MKHELPVPRHVVELISELQEAGYESYIVGGAIRDLLLGRAPKDFDISTSATPEEVRTVFGRRSARIIGKRFRLVHVTWSGELFEVSTFRQAPVHNGANAKKDVPENLILSDNSFGTAEEDAWRRDFTVNALFFDPVRSELIDFTGKGVEDIRNRVVRAIGDPGIRFEEDPVRMLRALKLIGQYDFTMESATENALFAHLELIRVAATSRLALELEKILASAYGDKHLQAFHDYGLLPFFLPELNAAWDTPHGDYALNLLNERNCRVREGIYRNSISLAMAALALPFVEKECEHNPGELWAPGPDSTAAIRGVLGRLFKPQTMMNRMTLSAERVLILQPLFRDEKAKPKLIETKSYPHSRELLLIRTAVSEEETAAVEQLWPPAPRRRSASMRSEESERPPKRRRRSGRSRRGKEKEKEA
ncbi:MAG: polynucleotide adenylyltransferase PcnB [Lentisphaeria bacterium]|nr:polynucleotide adenylyltransferase PcnB [Lentisphaeria bacterium]